MRAIALVVSALLPGASASARAQGEFLFNCLDPQAGNQTSFFYNGDFAQGPDLFVQVFAGPDRDHLLALEPLLPLNGTGPAPGMPPSHVFQVPGMAAGEQATVDYVGFKGSSLATATVRGVLVFGLRPVALSEPPAEPNTVLLGFEGIEINIPEPGTLALGSLGLGSLLLLSKRREPAGVED